MQGSADAEMAAAAANADGHARRRARGQQQGAGQGEEVGGFHNQMALINAAKPEALSIAQGIAKCTFRQPYY